MRYLAITTQSCCSSLILAPWLVVSSFKLSANFSDPVRLALILKDERDKKLAYVKGLFNSSRYAKIFRR